MFSKRLLKIYSICYKNNEFYRKIRFDLLLSAKRPSVRLFSHKSDLKLEESKKAMATKDIYDQSFFPSVLKQQGFSATKFKRFFSECKYERKPQLISTSDNGFWITECHLFEPQECNFKGRANRKKDSETIAMSKALMWLRDNQYVDNSFDEIKMTDQQIRQFFERINPPIDIKPIDKNLKNEMIRFCDDFDRQIKDEIIKICSSSHRIQISKDNIKEEFNDQLIETADNINGQMRSSPLQNLFNNRPYEEPNEKDLNQREIQLRWFVRKRAEREKRDQNFGELRRKMSELPINKYKEQILKTIEENRVTVISGDTGCGKTTQMPQIIFENELANQRAAFANIVVTQPRRLSAIAISERIAQEFGEDFVGNSIGYNVRFDKILPKQSNGAVLFCSSGILLRKLANNLSLKGVSHVIIDEVHERDVITDFLLVLLKRAIAMNPNIKVILMSASMNANLFVQYFECPLIEIPGRCYDVKHFYLNDFSDKIESKHLKTLFSPINPKIDINIVKGLINYIDRTKGDGAILVFLPGWPEIQSLMTALNENESSSSLMICPVHSRLPHSIQKRIFSKPPVGVRKVILATNIAETSLTIDDVVYVIDSGLAKEMRYNSRFNVSNFGTHWISKANAKQRSGRAGRVKEGECYRLWTPEVETSYMKEFPIPEILRIPLENVVMQTKFYCPNESVSQFLSTVPQPPPHTSIEKAIHTLKDINVLDKSEDLTLLGQRIVTFPIHPRLSVALVYSCFFSCLKSMLALVSQLSTNREPFQVMPDEKHLIRKVKNGFSYDFISDHISTVSLILEYQTISEDSNMTTEAIVFREDNHLHRYSMDNILETMKLFASHLEKSKLICDQSWSDVNSDVNFNWHHKYLLISALVPAFLPNIVRLMRGDIKNRKIKNDCLNPIDINTGLRVKFVAESVFSANFNSSPDLDSLSDALVLYFKSFYSEDARMLTICDASVVSPISVLLFAYNKFDFDCNSKTQRDLEKELVVVLRNNKYLRFRLNKDDFQVITRWTSILQLFFHWFLTERKQNELDIEENDKIISFLQDFFGLTQQLMENNSK